MKVLLTGNTGYIGSGVLQTLVADPNITSIFALSRRALPATHQHPKVCTIIHKDFTSYPASLLSKLSGTEAIIWSLGVKLTSENTMEEARAIEVTSTLTFARLCAEVLAPALPDGKKLRFVYVSGALGERDQEKRLWFATEARKMKGKVENELQALNVVMED